VLKQKIYETLEKVASAPELDAQRVQSKLNRIELNVKRVSSLSLFVVVGNCTAKEHTDDGFVCDAVISGQDRYGTWLLEWHTTCLASRSRSGRDHAHTQSTSLKFAPGLSLSLSPSP
jgi:hypothetical protein